MTRTEMIAALLIEHSKIRVDGRLACRCGHVYQIGKSIVTHRAEVIDGALIMQASGIDPEYIVDTVRSATTMAMANLS